MNPFTKKVLAFLLLSIVVLLGSCVVEEKEEVPPRMVRIAIIDTGFSPDAIPAEYIAEGANYLDPDKTTEDTYGHGTAIASILLEHAENVLLVPLVSNAYERGKISYVDSETLARMIREAVDIYDCEIINISAGLVLDKEAVRLAVSYAEEAGVLIVASVGNDYRENPGQMYYPAAYETVLAVGSLTSDGTAISEFSQRGQWANAFAVGENVHILTLSGADKTDSGSSYAAAKVTAAAVKYLQENEELTPAQLRELLCRDHQAPDTVEG